MNTSSRVPHRTSGLSRVLPFALGIGFNSSVACGADRATSPGVPADAATLAWVGRWVGATDGIAFDVTLVAPACAECARTGTGIFTYHQRGATWTDTRLRWSSWAPDSIHLTSSVQGRTSEFGGEFSLYGDFVRASDAALVGRIWGSMAVDAQSASYAGPVNFETAIVLHRR